MSRRSDDAFDEFFVEMIGEVVRVAERVLDDRAAAEDAAVEAMARAHARWARLRDSPYRQAWVLRVAINVALDMLRSDRRRRGRELLGAGSAIRSGFEEASIDRLVVSGALATLPRRQREAVALRWLADLPEKDTAEAMGVSPGSVKVHLRRGLSALGAPLAAEVTGGASDVGA